MHDENPKRKKNRLKDYDYNIYGSYFLTICTEDRKNLLGDVYIRYVRDKMTSGKEKLIPVNATVDLSEYGEIVKKYIESGKSAYPDIEIEACVIMPNHIHILLYVHDNTAKTRKVNEKIPLYVSALKRLVNKECGKNIFQRSYHDHIVRDDKDYDNIWTYIETNPLRWTKDCLYKEQKSFFTENKDKNSGQ